MQNSPSLPWKHQGVFKHALWALTGTGFALGFGWLWFGALQRFWLPTFLWGNLFRGNASLFFFLLVAGFTLALYVLYVCYKKEKQLEGDLAVERIEELPSGDFRSDRIPHIVHALSLAFICLGLFLPDATVLTDMLSAFCMAVAGICLGLYWTAALMTLPRREVFAAFIVACLAASALAFIYSCVPGTPPPWILVAACLTAWLMALIVSRLLAYMRTQAETAQKTASEQKRPRGRPVQRLEKANSPIAPHGAAFSLSDFTVPAIAFFVFGLGRVGVFPGAKTAFIDPWLSLILTACGALLVLSLLIYREKTGTPPVSLTIVMSAAIGVQGGVLVLQPSFFSVTSPLIEGAACLAVFALLAPVHDSVELPPASRQRLASLHGAFILWAALLFTNMGITAAGLLHRLCGSDVNSAGQAASWAGAVSLSAALLFLLTSLRSRRTYEVSVPKAVGPEDIFVGLTPREYEIAMLVVEGCSNKEIGERLNISEQTVRSHLKNVYKQTGLSDREALSRLPIDK